MSGVTSIDQPAPPMLSLQSVSCVFAARGDDGDSSPAARYVAVQDTQLEVAEGEFVSVANPCRGSIVTPAICFRPTR